jgi:hypothetical protein
VEWSVLLECRLCPPASGTYVDFDRHFAKNFSQPVACYKVADDVQSSFVAITLSIDVGMRITFTENTTCARGRADR